MEPIETGHPARYVLFNDGADGVADENSVPHREPADYAAGGGGGRTWHL